MEQILIGVGIVACVGGILVCAYNDSKINKSDNIKEDKEKKKEVSEALKLRATKSNIGSVGCYGTPVKSSKKKVSSYPETPPLPKRKQNTRKERLAARNPHNNDTGSFNGTGLFAAAVVLSSVDDCSSSRSSPASGSSSYDSGSSYTPSGSSYDSGSSYSSSSSCGGSDY